MKVEFQVPNSFELLPNLWVGGSPLVTTLDKDHEIDLLVFCADSYTPQMAKVHPLHDRHLVIELLDDNTMPTKAQIDSLRGLVKYLNNAYNQGTRIAITCQAAKNRSCTVAALLLVERGYPALEAIDLIRRERRGALTNHALNTLILSWKPS